MRRRILTLPVVFALVAVPAHLVAQSCIGVPVAESRNAVTAEIGFPESATAYGASFRHNVAGPLSVAASYGLSSYDDVDPKQHSVGGDVAYELNGAGVSACPTGGVAYSRISDEGGSVSAISVPLGVGFGKSFRLTNSASIVPHVVPQWIWTRATVDVGGVEASGEASMLAAKLGATIATPRFYFGGGVLWLDEDEADPVFSLMAGLPF